MNSILLFIKIKKMLLGAKFWRLITPKIRAPFSSNKYLFFLNMIILSEGFLRDHWGKLLIGGAALAAMHSPQEISNGAMRTFNLAKDLGSGLGRAASDFHNNYIGPALNNFAKSFNNTPKTQQTAASNTPPKTPEETAF